MDSAVSSNFSLQNIRPTSGGVVQTNTQLQVTSGMLGQNPTLLPTLASVFNGSNFLPPASSGGMNQPTAALSMSSVEAGQANQLLPTTSGGISQTTSMQPMPLNTAAQQSAFIPIRFSGLNQSTHVQPMSSGKTPSLDVQTLNNQNLQLELMALKISIEKFSPWKHVPLNWLDDFERFCNHVCQTYNTNSERFITNSLYSLFSEKDDKKWSIEQIDALQPFSWYLLKQQLLDYLAKRRNDKFKQVYMCEWDEPQNILICRLLLKTIGMS